MKNKEKWEPGDLYYDEKSCLIVFPLRLQSEYDYFCDFSCFSSYKIDSKSPVNGYGRSCFFNNNKEIQRYCLGVVK